jgi:hypothetical protein
LEGNIANQLLQPKFFHRRLECCIFVASHAKSCLKQEEIKSIMRNSYLVAGFIALFFTSFFISSCLNEDNKIPPNCYDGLLNNNEEQIDCGGPCPLCDPCTNGIWEPELGETWVDCGGECGECDQCSNGCKDGDEFGVDCGGSVCPPCGQLCGDGLPNGLEDGADPNCIAPNPDMADCGGPDCPACPTCVDGIMNGDEIGIDCGGPDCDPCATSGNCLNLIIDGDEDYTDCGGSTCPPCIDTLGYKVNGQIRDADIALSASLAGGTITIQGTTLGNEQIAFLIPEPGVGWLPGVSIQFNPATAPGQVGSYIDASAVAHGTAFGNANINMQILAVDAVAGGIIVGTFSGTVVSTDESTTLSIQQGYFLLNIP